MQQDKQPPTPPKDDEDYGALHRAARKIDPPSREPADDELSDPGNATPGAPPTDNRS